MAQFQLFFYTVGELTHWVVGLKYLPKIKNKNSFIAIDLRNHGKSDSSWKRWDVDENADLVISISRST